MRDNQVRIIIGQVSACFCRNSIAPEWVHDEAAEGFSKDAAQFIKDLEKALDVYYGRAWGKYAQKTGMKFAIVEGKITGLCETTPLCKRVLLFVPLSDEVTDLAKFAKEVGIPIVTEGPEYSEIVSALNERRLKKQEQEQTQNQATTTQS